MKTIHESFTRYGADSLSELDLLALICGNEEEARKISCTFQGFHEIARENHRAIAYLAGVSHRTAQRIDLCFEIGRRYRMSECNDDAKITTPKLAAAYLSPFLRDLSVERFMGLFLNNNKQVIGHKIISSGNATSTIVDPKILLKEAIVREANSIIIAHNHPSGYLKESSSDINLTKRIKKACDLVDIALDDHIIICNNDFISFKNKGLL
jgi:DNA repair protein RadC